MKVLDAEQQECWREMRLIKSTLCRVVLMGSLFGNV